jgi:elongation factor G
MPQWGSDPDRVHVFALVGHRSSGKTALGDALLRCAAATRTLGRVDDGTSLLDHGEEERRRHMTLGLSFAWVEWQDSLVQFIDTPGVADLSHERDLGLYGADAAVVVVGGSDGVEAGTREVIARARELRIPVMFVVNKADRAMDFAAVLEQLDGAVSGRVVPLQLPFHSDDGSLAGVVDLCPELGGVSGVLPGAEPGEPVALRYATDGTGAWSPEPVPRALVDEAGRRSEALREAVALTDDDLLEQYLEELTLPPARLVAGLAAAVRAGKIVPVVYTAASTVLGVERLLDFAVALLPAATERELPLGLRDRDGDEGFVAQHLATRLDDSGAPFSVLRVWRGRADGKGHWHGVLGEAVARVRRLYGLRGPRRAAPRAVGPGAILATWEPLPSVPGETWRVVSGPAAPAPSPPAPMLETRILPVHPTTPETLAAALARLRPLDPSLAVSENHLTGDVVLRGQGETHLARAIGMLRARLGVSIREVAVPVHYRETPSARVDLVPGVHRRTRGTEVIELGEVLVRLSPRDPSDGIVFISEVDEDVLPARFVAAAEDGILAAMRHGPLGGYPVTGVEVALIGGDYHALRSEEAHFEAAGRRAVEAALAAAGTRVLEPWSDLVVHTDSGTIGSAMAEITTRGGRIGALDVGVASATIRAECPTRALPAFARRLKAVTGGAGRYASTIGPLRPLDPGLVSEAIATSPFSDHVRGLTGGRGSA